MRAGAGRGDEAGRVVRELDESVRGVDRGGETLLPITRDDERRVEGEWVG